MTALEAQTVSLRELAELSRAWPFEEARKIVARLKKKPKDEVIFETGYGPSGLPHIGTFGEVARTSMVRHAFRVLTEDKIKTRLLAYSDDMDGLRKVPDNVPNKEMLTAYLGGAQVPPRSAAVAFQVLIGHQWRTFATRNIGARGIVRQAHQGCPAGCPDLPRLTRVRHCRDRDGYSSSVRDIGTPRGGARDGGRSRSRCRYASRSARIIGRSEAKFGGGPPEA